MNSWRSKILSLPLDDYAAWQSFDDEYADKFVQREFSKLILEYLFEPQMHGFHYQSPDEISRIHALMLLSFILRKSKILNLRQGLVSLPEKTAELLNIRLNCSISSLDINSNGKVILKSNNDKFYADRVILTAPATISKYIFKSANAIESKLLQTKYNPTINISVATHTNWKLPKKLQNVYGILIPWGERQSIAGIGIETNKDPSKITRGMLLNIMLDSIHGIKYFNLADNEILQAIYPELEYSFPNITHAINLTHIIRWQNAEPLSYLSKSKDINSYRTSLHPSAPIILAGDYLSFPYTDGASFTGKWAANFIKCSDN